MNKSYASLLVFHGSRNKEQYLTQAVQLNNLVQKKLWENSAKHLPISQTSLETTATNKANSLQKLLSQPSDLVELAVLEFALVELSQQIIDFAKRAIALNYQKVIIVPVFLSAGVHVTEDIPEAIAVARQHLGDSIVLELRQYIGSSVSLANPIKQQFEQLNTEGRILLAHGNRLPQGNVAIEKVAKEVDAMVAYWTIQPDLTSTIESLVNQGIASIAIVPYFLFSGRITKAIASLVNESKDRFSHTQIFFGKPLGTKPELARVIIECIIQN